MNLEKFMIAAVAVLFLCVVQAYVHLPMAWKASSPLGLDITSRDVDLTDAMKVRIEEKIGKVIHKLGRDALSSHVVLKINRLPATEHHTHTVKKNSHMAEVTVGFKGGHVVHAAEKSDDMYGSIDSVAHKLGHLLQKHHSKVVDKSHKARVSLAKSLTAEVLEVSEGRDEGREEQGDGREDRVTSKHDDVEEEDTMLELDMQYRNTDRVVPNGKLTVVKKKLFSMPPISIEEAITALELVDHPFYVFRNKDTNEINLVYKRDAGGAGHIAPAHDHPAPK